MTLLKSSRTPAILMALLICVTSAIAREPRHLTLAEAVQLAIEHNRSLNIARLKVKENEYKKDEAHSDYLPAITNQSNILHITELQNLVISQGAFGNVSGVPVPSQTTTVPQG